MDSRRTADKILEIQMRHLAASHRRREFVRYAQAVMHRRILRHENYAQARSPTLLIMQSRSPEKCVMHSFFFTANHIAFACRFRNPDIYDTHTGHSVLHIWCIYRFPTYIHICAYVCVGRSRVRVRLLFDLLLMLPYRPSVA